MIQHWDAWCNLIGSLFGLLGGFYLAYDLLGGKKGPLSGMTRMVTYFFLYGFGYTLGLGVKFAVVGSLGLSLLLAVEFFIESRKLFGRRPRPQWVSIALGSGRSLFLALGVALLTDWTIGLILFPLSSLALSFLNLVGFSPADDRHLSRHLEFNSRPALAALLRGLISALCCWAAEALASPAGAAQAVPPWRYGLTLGATSLFVSVFEPWVEWKVETLSQRWLAALGVLFVILGFILQALPNWVVLLG